jgi:hypothetical protein
MLVLLVGGIYEVCLEMASCGMMYVPSSMTIGRGAQAILRFCLKKFERL